VIGAATETGSYAQMKTAMPTRVFASLLLAVLFASLSGCASTRPPSGSEPASKTSPTLEPVDLTLFQDALEPYGDWIESASYGTVWSPYALPAGWRPYTTGRWLSTDHGWMWLEDEPWGWAAFHYGRWTFDDGRGWVWIPGPTWAPAWVAWRSGQGYVGWAPLPLDVDRKKTSSEKPDDLSRGVDPMAWSFLRTREFSAISIDASVLPVGRNPTLLSLTHAAGRYAPYGSRVAERGFSESGAVERTRRYRVTDAATYRQNRATVVKGSTVEIYRPEAIAKKPSAEASPSTRRPPGSGAQENVDRERREQSRFDVRMAQERERLRREQEREIRQRPNDLSEQKLQRRQKDEVEAQERFEQRERAAMEARRERLRRGGG